jgi:thiol-disulfide isomerase/thioredoxin
VELCDTCLPKSKHEHHLVEYLVPKQNYLLEQLLHSVPYLLDPNNEEQIETKTLWKDGVNSIEVYFSAHWCSLCREFTPKLAKFDKEAQESSQSLRLVFVSCDNNEKAFNEYRAIMPWSAVPLNLGALLKPYFQFSCKCLLIIFILQGDNCPFL